MLLRLCAASNPPLLLPPDSLSNIFIAIIMSAYDATLKMNPDAADASNFVSMVVMQAKRVLAAAVGVSQEDYKGDETMPMVLDNTMSRIGDEEYWDIFEGYFDLPSSDDEAEPDEAGDDDGAGGEEGQGDSASQVAELLLGGGEGKQDSGGLASLARELVSMKQQQGKFQAAQEAKLNALAKQQQELMGVLNTMNQSLRGLGTASAAGNGQERQ